MLRLHDICRHLQFADNDDNDTNHDHHHNAFVFEQLDLCGQNIGLNGAMALSSALKTNRSLRVLNLSYNLIPPRGAVALVRSIPGSVQILDLRDNGVGNDGAQAIGELLTVSPHCTTLTTVMLRNNGIGATGAMHLATALSIHDQVGHPSSGASRLQKLDLSRNLIGNHGAQAVAAMLKTNDCLEWLSIWNNGIDGEGMGFVADALRVNTSLKVLVAGGNYVSDDGAAALADALMNNQLQQHHHHRRRRRHYQDHHYQHQQDQEADHCSSLEVLNLGSSQVGTAGALSLARMLRSNKTLQCLDLFQNPIGNAGAHGLYEALQTDNSTLYSLHIDYQRCQDETTVVTMTTDGPVSEVDTPEKSRTTVDDKKKRHDGWINEAILAYLALNRAGRARMNDVSMPWELWPTVLEKFRTKPQLCYLALREKPELLQGVSGADEEMQDIV